MVKGGLRILDRDQLPLPFRHPQLHFVRARFLEPLRRRRLATGLPVFPQEMDVAAHRRFKLIAPMLRRPLDVPVAQKIPEELRRNIKHPAKFTSADGLR